MYYDKSSVNGAYYLFYRGKHEEGQETQFTPPHCHDTFEIMAVTKGYVDVVLNGEAHRINEGEILFLDRYDIHSFTFENCERYSLVFSKDYCRMLLDGNGTLANYPECGKDAFNEIKQALDKYFYLYGEKIPSGLLVESLASFILGTIEHICGRIERNERAGELMVEILEYIKENSDSELTLSDVAAKFGYTPSYFSSLFNKLVQMNFNDYVNYIRYTRAAEIIQLQGCTATNIAMKCGFGSMNSFYRAKNKFDKKP